MKTEEKSMKNVEKVFTKEKRNNIINKDYNPLSKDYEKFTKEGVDCL